MLITLPDATTLDVDLKRCSQCGRIGERHFLAIPTDSLGGPELFVCSGRQACQRRSAKAAQTQATVAELRNPPRPAPAEDVPTGQVKDWKPSTRWTAAQQETHYRDLALELGIDPSSPDAVHPRVRARTARPRKTAA